MGIFQEKPLVIKFLICGSLKLSTKVILGVAGLYS